MVKIHMATRKNLTVPQSRMGRRPMSVGTMLRKERDGSLFKLRSISADLGESRNKTIKLIQDWAKRTRYGKAADDFDSLTDNLVDDINPDTYKTASEFGKNSAGYDLQGRTEIHGLSIAIENKPGSKRSGKNEDGSTWETTFKSPYGYIEGTLGADGEEIDAYVGPDKDSTQVFIVHQRKANGSHDEDTVMLGYKTKGDAKSDILRHYEDTSLIGGIDQMSIEDFKAKLDKADGKAISKIARLLTEDECRARGRQYMKDNPGWVSRLGVKSATIVEKGDMLSSVEPDRDRIVRRLQRLAARRSPEPEKQASGLASEQANLDYREGDPMDTTGLPAELARKKWEGPTRVMQDPYPKPTVENRQEIQETKLVGSLLPPEGYEDTGKYAGLGKDRALAQERKSWEGPTRDDVGTNPVGKHRLQTATGAEAVTLSGIAPEAKIAMLEQTIRNALKDELQKIAQASGQPVWDDFEKYASSELVDSLVKEAIFRQMAGSLSRGLVGGVSPQGVPMKGLLSGFKGVGHRMEQAGTRMMTSPAQRIQAAGASAGEAQQLAGQAARFGVKAPGVAKRIGGEAVQTAGKHVAHSSPLQLALNPIGTAIGGGIEGATRGAGRELVRSAGSGSRIRAGVGQAMQRHAGKAGVVGEIGTLGALGGLAHMPLSAAGALGGGIAHAAPAIGHGLAHLGAVGGHVGADAIGTIAQKAGKLLPHAAKATGKLLQATT